MIKSKGMRNIQTLHGLAHRDRAVLGTRAQTVNELAYLEHSRDQVERELQIWTNNHKRAECRLQSVNQRIALLQEALEPSAEHRAASSDQEVKADSQEAGTSCREFALEY
jgi:hypothetical protein